MRTQTKTTCGFSENTNKTKNTCGFRENTNKQKTTCGFSENTNKKTPVDSVRTETNNTCGFRENRNKKYPGARSFRSAAPTLWNRLPNTAQCRS